MTDGRTDGETDESNFTGRCQTNVERPKIMFGISSMKQNRAMRKAKEILKVTLVCNPNMQLFWS